METTASEISRVSDSIAEPIINYFRQHGKGYTFRMSDLLEYVRTGNSFVAPDSPGRIMRDLRLKGVIGYTLLSRRGSEYMVTFA